MRRTRARWPPDSTWRRTSRRAWQPRRRRTRRTAAMVFTDSAENERRPTLTADQLQGLLDAAQMLAGKGKKTRGARQVPRGARDAGQSPRSARLGGRLPAEQARVRAAARGAAGERRHPLASRRAGGDQEGAAARRWPVSPRGTCATSTAPSRPGRRSCEPRSRKTTAATRGARASLRQDATLGRPGGNLARGRRALAKKISTPASPPRRSWRTCRRPSARTWSRPGKPGRASPSSRRRTTARASTGVEALRAQPGGWIAPPTVLTRHAAHVEDPVARGQFARRDWPSYASRRGDLIGAGTAYGEAADAVKSGRLWESAERCFVSRPTTSAPPPGPPSSGPASPLRPSSKRRTFFRASELFARAGLENESMARLEQAAVSRSFQRRVRRAAGRSSHPLASAGTCSRVTSRRAAIGLTDRSKRVAVRRQAAALYALQLGNKDLRPASSGSRCSRTATTARRSRS